MPLIVAYMAETPDTHQDSKHPGGRPLKYETAIQLDLAIQLYQYHDVVLIPQGLVLDRRELAIPHT